MALLGHSFAARALSAPRRSEAKHELQQHVKADCLTPVQADVCTRLTGCAVLCLLLALQTQTSNEFDVFGAKVVCRQTHCLDYQRSHWAALCRLQDSRQCLRSSWHAGWLSTR